MDARIARLIDTLKASGYSDRYVPEQWSDNWCERLWYGFEGVSESILQIITGNVYTRVVDVGEDEPLMCLQYRSADHPALPKTDFYRDHTPVPVRKSLEEVLRFIPGLETL